MPRPVLLGAVLGLAWSASLRGYLAQLAGPDPEVTWIGTFAVILPAGAVAGALLGRSWGTPVRRPKLVLPLVLVILAASAVLIGLGFGRAGLDPATPHGAWVATLAATLYVLLCLACTIPLRRRPYARGATGVVLLGALTGLAWAAALRAFMSEVAGPGTGASWVGTFGWILAPGLLAGALLGWAEHLRRSGGSPRRRWLILSPLLFASVLLAGLADPATMFEGGVGGGAIGVPILGILGGCALSGRGRPAVRLLCGSLPLAGCVVWVLIARTIAPHLAVSTPRGAWAACLFFALLGVLALACAVPLLRSDAGHNYHISPKKLGARS